MKLFFYSFKILAFILSNFLLLISCRTADFLESTSQASIPSIPLQDFFSNPESKTYRLSPNGKRLAYLKSYKQRMHIFVRTVDKPFIEKRITHKLNRDIQSLSWCGNDTLLFKRDFAGNENFHLFSISIEFKNKNNILYKEKALTPYSKATYIRVYGCFKNKDSYRILVSHNQRDKRFFDLYRFNLKTGKTTLVIKNDTHAFDMYLPNRFGDVLFVGSVKENSFFYRKSEKYLFKKIFSMSSSGTLEPLAFAQDNKTIYALSTHGGRDKMALVKWDLGAQREIQELFSHPNVDVGYPSASFGWSKKKQRLLYINYNTWKQHYHFFDSEFKAHFKSISSQLQKEDEIHFVSDENQNRLLIYVKSDRSPGSYYLYNKTTHQLTLIAKSRPWIKESEMAKVKPITYKSRDGWTIHGYLALPPHQSSRNLSAIIMPHGGPWWRDLWGFKPEVQFFANQGYAVLQMNFRGSLGYGQKFWKASFRQRGLKMQDDVTDGVNWLITQGVADPKRIGIYGKSYGGYVTLAGLAFTPNLYRAGVSYGGISNLFTHINLVPPPYREKAYQAIGHPEKDKEILKTTSPLFHVEKIKAPLFIAHGAKDPVVHRRESDQMVKALREHGKEVVYMLQKNEGHSFQNEENRLNFYQNVKDFFSKHLKPSFQHDK